MKTNHIIWAFVLLPLLCSCRSSRSMLKEIQSLKSSLYYELTSPTYPEKVEQTVYMDFIDYSNMDYYTGIQRKRSILIPLFLYNYEGELFHLRLGESSLTRLYRNFLTEALLTECNSSTCCQLIDNAKGKMIPASAYRLEVKIRKNKTSAKVKLNQSSIPWFDGEIVEIVSNKILPATSGLAISIRLTQKDDCLLDKTYSIEYRQPKRNIRFEDSPSANAACLDDMTECLSMATKEIVEEISRDLHLILSLQPKSRANYVYHYWNYADRHASWLLGTQQKTIMDT